MYLCQLILNPLLHFIDLLENIRELIDCIAFICCMTFLPVQYTFLEFIEIKSTFQTVKIPNGLIKGYVIDVSRSMQVHKMSKL